MTKRTQENQTPQAHSIVTFDTAREGMNQTPNNSPYLTPAEVRTRFKVSGMTLFRWRRNGTLPALKMGRSTRYAVADVLAFEAQARA